MRATPTSASAIAINLCKAQTNFLIFSQNSLAISVNRGNNNSNNNVASQHEDLHNGCRLLPTKRRAWPMLQQTRATLTHEIEVCVRVCAGVCVCVYLFVQTQQITKLRKSNWQTRRQQQEQQ